MQSNEEKFKQAVESGDVDRMKKILLEAPSLDVNGTIEGEIDGECGSLPFILFAPDLATIRLLLDHGADPNASDDSYRESGRGIRLLQKWCRKNDDVDALAVMKLLLQRGAKPNLPEYGFNDVQFCLVPPKRIEVVEEDVAFFDHSYFFLHDRQLEEVEKPVCPCANCACKCGRHSMMVPKNDSSVRKIIAIHGMRLMIQTEEECSWYDLEKTVFPDPFPQNGNGLARMYMRWCFPKGGIPCPLGGGDTDSERQSVFAMTLFAYLADVGLARGYASAEGTEIFTTVFLLPALEAEATVVRRAAEKAGIDMNDV